MKYFLDTNTIIYFLKGENTQLVNRFHQIKPEDIKIPSIVFAELLVGAEKSSKRIVTLEKVNKFVERFEIIAFGEREARAYSKVRSDLEKLGEIIGPNDLLIAAIVLEANGKLVTNNEKEFKRIKSLSIENWLA